MKNSLSISHLSVNYAKSRALWDLSLEVPPGKMVAVIGPNGAGKSTFLKTCLGLLSPISGEISLLGQPLKKMAQNIAYVPQKEMVDWDFPMTLFELVLMGTYPKLGLFRWPGKKEKEKVRQKLKLLGLESLADRQIDELSGGQKQRAFMARALCQEASLYFLDEPFSGIDVASSEVILSILQELKAEGKSLFIVHHDLEMVARGFDWAILLNTHLIANGPVGEVLTQENLVKAYGNKCEILNLATKMAQEKGGEEVLG